MSDNHDGQHTGGVSFNKEYGAGVLAMVIGLFAAWTGSTYDIGSLRHMGPGFFPVAIGILLALTGVAIALGGVGHTAEAGNGPLAERWRGWLCIVGGIAAFIVLGHFAGLLPATFGIVFISALGDRANTVKGALILAVAMSIVATVVFWWLLRMQFPLLNWG